MDKFVVKHKRSRLMIALMFLSGIFFVSCIKDEALNTEADIESATVADALQILQIAPIVTGNTVTFRLKQFSGSYNYAPEFTLTPGATIHPSSGTLRDFKEPQLYTVTSEDGVWQKTYTVSFIIDEKTEMNSYSFENAEVVDTENPEGHFHRFYELTLSGQKRYDWATANEGYNILAQSLVGEGEQLVPEFYPSSQTTVGFEGKGVKLQTKSTGALGAIMKSPLAAGNIYLGIFNLTFPSIKSTLFGMPYTSKEAPKALKGYFKYKAGANFVINTQPTALIKDTWDVYAILFEKSEANNFLSGDHAFKDPRMVRVARIKPDQRIETGEWTAFEIPFENVNGKSFDPSKEYMFTIVFSSSLEGDLYNGAVGSTLFIDEVQIVKE